MTLPVPTFAHRTPSGWADERLMKAYDLVYGVMSDHTTAEDRMPELRQLLVEIEKVDDVVCQIIRSRTS